MTADPEAPREAVRRVFADAPPPAIGVAVSGGGDSVALLLAARAAYPGHVRAVTVDHGLRAESADEARAVGALCGAIGIAHDILRYGLR